MVLLLFLKENKKIECFASAAIWTQGVLGKSFLKEIATKLLKLSPKNPQRTCMMAYCTGKVAIMSLDNYNTTEN